MKIETLRFSAQGNRPLKPDLPHFQKDLRRLINEIGNLLAVNDAYNRRFLDVNGVGHIQIYLDGGKWRCVVSEKSPDNGSDALGED